jgi:hypothetical protein
MHDPAHGIGALFLQQAQGVDSRFAGMHDQGFAASLGCPDVRPETLSLPLGLVLLPVVVKPCFTDGNNLGVLARAKRRSRSGSSTSVYSGCTPTVA